MGFAKEQNFVLKAATRRRPRWRWPLNQSPRRRPVPSFANWPKRRGGGGGVRKVEIALAEALHDGIAMALLDAARELPDVTKRIDMLVNEHAMRRGVSLTAE